MHISGWSGVLPGLASYQARLQARGVIAGPLPEPVRDAAVSGLGGADSGRDRAGNHVGRRGLDGVCGRGDASCREAEHGIAVVERVRGAHRPENAIVRDRRDPVGLFLGELRVGQHRTEGGIGPGDQ